VTGSRDISQRAEKRPDLVDRAADAGSTGEHRLEAPAGLSDSANQFHYYRLTCDNRILWGGYDAVYHCRS
jgi:hypothetical protein